MNRKAFALIELLGLAACLAILAVIAIPNTREAKTRSNYSKVLADHHKLIVATHAYRLDNEGGDPAPLRPGNPPSSDDRWFSGFTNSALTTPIPYLQSMPLDPFPDDLYANLWTSLDPDKNTMRNMPYVVVVHIYRNGLPLWHYSHAAIESITAAGHNMDLSPNDIQRIVRANSIFISAGPVNRLTLLDRGRNSAFAFYDPTNGLISDGDIIGFE